MKIVAFGVLILAFVGGFLRTTLQADGHGIGWKYADYTTITVEDGNGITYASQLATTVSQYDGTDLGLTMPSCSSSCDIIVNEANWGYSWTGFADPINVNSQYCVSFPSGSLTGNCNTTTAKASHGYVYLNTGDYPLTNAQATHILLHEFGHHFGLDHVECWEADSVMMLECGTYYTSLRSHDTSDINALYP